MLVYELKPDKLSNPNPNDLLGSVIHLHQCALLVEL